MKERKQKKQKSIFNDKISPWQKREKKYISVFNDEISLWQKNMFVKKKKNTSLHKFIFNSLRWIKSVITANSNACNCKRLGKISAYLHKSVTSSSSWISSSRK